MWSSKRSRTPGSRSGAGPSTSARWTDPPLGSNPLARGVARSHPPPSLDADGVLSRYTDCCFNNGPRDAVQGPAAPFPAPRPQQKLCSPTSIQVPLSQMLRQK